MTVAMGMLLAATAMWLAMLWRLLKVRIREPMPSELRSAAPNQAQVTRLPMAEIQNTITIIAKLATLALLAMNDPAVAAASIHAFGSGLPERKRL
jgi:hypothetical protein